MVSPQAAATGTDHKPISVLVPLGSSQGGQCILTDKPTKMTQCWGRLFPKRGGHGGLSPEERGMDPGQGEKWVFSKHFPNASQRAVFSRLKAK